MHLYKLLLKIRIMASAPSFPRHVQTTVDAAKKPLDTPCANVQARLFKSDPVKAAMTEVLGGIRRILGVDEVKVSVNKKRLRAKDYENGLPGEKSVETLVSSNKKISVPIYQDSEDWGELSGQEGAVAAGKGSGGDTEEEGYDVYGSRLAASSNEDSRSEESASENTEIEDLDPDSITEGDIDSDTEESHPLPKSKPKSTKAASLGAAPKSTTFLPSLSMGGYWSGSDSAEDLSDTEPQGRKNRMGQQARRALWEKKFGKNANHIKKQPQNRDEGWDARRGASVGDERGKRGRGRGGFRRESGRSRGGGGRGPMSSGANSDPIAMRKTKPKPAADAPLHPSWEAAKKAKEQKKTVAFQGKKVVFD